MSFNCRKIRKYGYQLTNDYEYTLPKRMEWPDATTPFIIIKNGVITVKKGYMWDGASGPTIDTKNNMRASLIHDCLYQFFRLSLLPREVYKPLADLVLYNVCREDGMSKIRAGYFYIAVKLFGYSSTLPLKNEDIVNY